MTFPRDTAQDGNQVPAPDPNAPGTLVGSSKPDRYGEPFYATSNVMAVRCKECSTPSHLVAIPVDLVRAHDDDHDSDYLS